MIISTGSGAVRAEVRPTARRLSRPHTGNASDFASLTRSTWRRQPVFSTNEAMMRARSREEFYDLRRNGAIASRRDVDCDAPITIQLWVLV
jgi:hypothetical protein